MTDIHLSKCSVKLLFEFMYIIEEKKFKFLVNSHFIKINSFRSFLETIARSVLGVKLEPIHKLL